MRTPSRSTHLTIAAMLLVVVAACGDDYATSIETLPPIRTTTTTMMPSTTIDNMTYYYTIQPGDNLNRIATTLCVPLREITAINADVLPDPNNIPVGVQIEIPKNVGVIGCEPATTPAP